MHFPYIRPNLVITVTLEMKIPSLYQILVISIHANITKKVKHFNLLCYVRQVIISTFVIYQGMTVLQ